MRKLAKISTLIGEGMSPTRAVKTVGLSWATYQKHANTNRTTVTTTMTTQTTTNADMGFVSLVYKTVADQAKARTLVKAFYETI